MLVPLIVWEIVQTGYLWKTVVEIHLWLTLRSSHGIRIPATIPTKAIWEPIWAQNIYIYIYIYHMDTWALRATSITRATGKAITALRMQALRFKPQSCWSLQLKA